MSEPDSLKSARVVVNPDIPLGTIVLLSPPPDNLVFENEDAMVKWMLENNRIVVLKNVKAEE